jgi:hypothetical protein
MRRMPPSRLALALLAACATTRPATRPPGPPSLETAAAPGLAAIKPEALRAHILFLADDLLEGRAPGTRGYDIAARYVATQLAALGLEPAGQDGSYFQAVPLRAMTRVDAGCALEVGGAAIDPAHLIVAPFAGSERAEVEGPVVYAGFGVAAPDQGYDDTAGVDLEGAIVVVFRGAPASFAPAAARAVHSDPDRKAEHLAARGARAIVVVHWPEAEQMRPWKQRLLDARFESMVWMDGDRPGAGPTIPVASVDMTGFQALLGGDADAAALWSEAAKGAARPRRFTRRARLRVASTFRDLTSPNVVAVLRGSDPDLAAEHVVYSAHLDHLGMGTPVDGDAIYNGALDNATGVAGIIEVARAFTALPARPPRSILFVAVTAEEKGLLGSDYFAHHPTVPIASLVANVNLDGLNPLHEMFDVIALGADHSTLRRNVEEAAATMGLPISPDPHPEMVFFIRSDQYSFVKQGIPALFPGAGSRDATGATAANEALFEAWFREHYHQPSDEWRDGELDARWLAKEARFCFLVGLSIARDPARPSWNPGDPFATVAVLAAR